MARNVRRTVIAALAAMAGWGMPARAQAPVEMRFTPDLGVRLHSVVTTEGSALIQEQGAPEGSGISMQYRRREAITLQAVRDGGSGLVVDVTHDSVASRGRPAGGLWQGIDSETLPAASARALLDPRLQVQSIVEGTLRTGLVGGFDITLPVGPVGAGGQWEAEIGLPVHGRAMVRTELGLDDRLRIDGRLRATATFVIDSVVPRNTDTLVYLSVSGQVTPRTMVDAAEASNGSVRATGALGGSLIWSTGWKSFVSGAIRSIVVLGVRYGPPGQSNTVPIEVRLDGTTQFQLRP
jgi:hypothetical protein